MPERAGESAAFHVGPARPWQAPRLTEITFAAKRHWGYPEDWIRLWWDELVVSQGYLTGAVALAATRRGRTAGWTGASFEDGAWWLDHLWGEPAYMGRGIGSALLDALAAEVVTRGATRLVIVADPNAAGFYERAGATRIGDAPSARRPRRIPVYELALPGDARTR